MVLINFDYLSTWEGLSTDYLGLKTPPGLAATARTPVSTYTNPRGTR